MAIVLSWGTGRKDFSENVEESVVPITRSHQYRTMEATVADLSAFDWLTIEISDLFGPMLYFVIAPVLTAVSHMLYETEVSYDSNVLIKAYFGLMNSAGTVCKSGTEYGVKYGYRTVKFSFPTGYPITVTDTEEGWLPMLGFVPGGYSVRATMSFIRDTLAESG